MSSVEAEPTYPVFLAVAMLVDDAQRGDSLALSALHGLVAMGQTFMGAPPSKRALLKYATETAGADVAIGGLYLRLHKIAAGRGKLAVNAEKIMTHGSGVVVACWPAIQWITAWAGRRWPDIERAYGMTFREATAVASATRPGAKAYQDLLDWLPKVVGRRVGADAEATGMDEVISNIAATAGRGYRPSGNLASALAYIKTAARHSVGRRGRTVDPSMAATELKRRTLRRYRQLGLVDPTVAGDEKAQAVAEAFKARRAKMRHEPPAGFYSLQNAADELGMTRGGVCHLRDRLGIKRGRTGTPFVQADIDAMRAAADPERARRREDQEVRQASYETGISPRTFGRQKNTA